MSQISGISPSPFVKDGGENQPKSKSVLAKDDFLKLFLTQIQNQDPMKPMDHHEFATQLAQFGQLEQLQNIGSGIQGLKSNQQEGSKLEALGMIGKRVDARSSDIEVTMGNKVTIPTPANSEISPTKVMIYDGGGKLVREFDLAAKQSGATSLEWDGKDTQGQAVKSGNYSYRIIGLNKNGSSQEIPSEFSGQVVGVDMNGATPVLLVKSGDSTRRLDLSKIKQVSIDDTSVKQPKIDVKPTLGAGENAPPEGLTRENQEELASLLENIQPSDLEQE